MLPGRLRFVTGLVFWLCLSSIARAQSPGTFADTGSMSPGQAGNTATLLNNGNLLIAGGINVISHTTRQSATADAQVYSVATKAFAPTGNMTVARDGHTATLLNNGVVLIAGGSSGSSGPGSQTLQAAAELYNPATGTFAATGNLNAPRFLHTATLLNNGMVLIAGGGTGRSSLASAELYNPATGAFTPTGNLNIARQSHTATLLNNGMVLIAGGAGATGYLASAELYNPATGTFTLTGSFVAGRSGHTATLLNNGMVLIAGGYNTSYLGSADLYNPATGQFSPTGSLNYARAYHSATLLNNGTVLIAGGYNTSLPPPSLPAIAELYNPATGSFGTTGSLITPREGHTATLLESGDVLIAGGESKSCTICSPLGGWGIVAQAELYAPLFLTPSSLLSITLNPVSPFYIPIGNTQIFAGTGTFSGNSTETLASATWTSSNTAVASISNDVANYGHLYAVTSGTTTVTACAGSVCGSTTVTVAPHSNMVIGSMPGDAGSATFEKYSDAGALLLTGNLAIARSLHSAVLLQNGTIFVAGGTGDTTSCQIFDQNGKVLSTGLLQDGRVSTSVALLNNGNVFLAGGVTGIPTAAPGTWEIRSPTCGLVASGNLTGIRGSGSSAVTLHNGNVWSSGGAISSGDACTFEIRNPTGGLVSSGSLESCFAGGQVQVLANGNVMLLAGDNAPGTYEIRSQAGAFVSTGSLENGFNHGANSVLLNNGNVFIFGSCELGTNPPDVKDPYDNMDLAYDCPISGATSTWEIRDVNGNFVATGSLQDQRDGSNGSSIAVLSNGNVFITGGNLSPGSWEIRSQTGAFVSSGSLFDARYGGHTTVHF
jgi:hypothetical protein